MKPLFAVYIADLNSLYDDQPRCPVVLDLVDNEEAAAEKARNAQDHETAAWFEPIL